MNPQALIDQWMAHSGAHGQLYPGVIERGSATERMIEVDVRAKLIEQRIIFLGDVIYPSVANIIISQMLFLQHQRRDADIYVFINSPGGSIEAGMAIYDTMQYVQCDVSIEARELEDTKKHLNGLLARHSGRTIEEMEKATDRNKWMTATEAVEFGLADEVVVVVKPGA